MGISHFHLWANQRVLTIGNQWMFKRLSRSFTCSLFTQNTRKSPILPSVLVAEYWDDVMKYSKDPDSFTLGHETHKRTDYKTIRTLITRVIKTKREDGDIWPSLLCREVCEFYEQSDEPTKVKFLEMLASDFNVDYDLVKKYCSQVDCVYLDESRIHQQ